MIPSKYFNPASLLLMLALLLEASTYKAIESTSRPKKNIALPKDNHG
jgi:hypothetical protein